MLRGPCQKCSITAPFCRSSEGGSVKNAFAAVIAAAHGTKLDNAALSVEQARCHNAVAHLIFGNLGAGATESAIRTVAEAAGATVSASVIGIKIIVPKSNKKSMIAFVTFLPLADTLCAKRRSSW